MTMETLIPDFKAKWDALYMVCDEAPEVISHNMETVRELYRQVRPQAKYERSLEQIKRTKARGIRTKTGIMVGLGETKEQLYRAMDDLVAHGCDVLTLGQYLQPTKMHRPVAEYIHPDVFEEYKEVGLAKGLDYVESGPLVRSSYHAERHLSPRPKRAPNASLGGNGLIYIAIVNRLNELTSGRRGLPTLNIGAF